MFPLTSLPVQRAAPLWDTRILQAEVPPPPLVLGHSRGRCKSWKIWAVINDLRFNPVSWPGSDFLHLGVVEECLIVWDIVESKVVIGQDHLCKQQVVGGKTSLSRGENFNQGCLFVQKNLNPSMPIWDILRKKIKRSILSRNQVQEFSLVCCDPQYAQQAHGQCWSPPSPQCIPSPWQGSWKGEVSWGLWCYPDCNLPFSHN